MKHNILQVDIEIDDNISDADKTLIAMFHELGPIEQKFYYDEIQCASEAAKRCRQNDIENAHRKEMQI